MASGARHFRGSLGYPALISQEIWVQVSGWAQKMFPIHTSCPGRSTVNREVQQQSFRWRVLRPIGHLTPMPPRCLVLEGTDQWDKGEQPGWEVFSSSRRKEKLLGGVWRWRWPGGVGGRVWGPASVPATYSSVPCFLPVTAGGTPCCSLPAHMSWRPHVHSPV